MLTFRKVMLPLAALALLISSCSKENLQEPIIAGGEVEATFSIRSNETTRASGSSWEAGDIIGIYALKTGMTLAADAIYGGKANIAYENTVDGSAAIFTAVTNPIRYPADGSAIDFVAYYPYNGTVTSDYQLAINLTQQSPLSAIDLMYATSSGHTKANPSVPLTFTHSLSRFKLTLTAEEGLLLEGATVAISNVLTEGNMELASGTVTAGTTTGTITPEIIVDVAANSAVATAILLPGQQSDALQVEIQLADGKQYHWSPEAAILVAGKDYSYTLNLTDGTTDTGDAGSDPTASDLFFSEYIEGSSSNKYLEIFNGTGHEVDLTAYRVVLYSNGSTTPGNTLPLTGSLPHGAVVVIKNSNATLYAGEAITSTVTYFNGDDALALEKLTDGGSSFTAVDIFGRIGEDPGSDWIAAGGYSTSDMTLRRKSTVRSGVILNPEAGFPTLNTEWDLYPQDEVLGLGSHTME